MASASQSDTSPARSARVGPIRPLETVMYQHLSLSWRLCGWLALQPVGLQPVVRL